jgi:hypothetical protein
VSVQEILDREARWARPAAFAAILGVLCFVGSQIGLASVLEADNDHEFLREFADESGSALPYHLLASFSFILIGAALVYLFRAAHARSESVRGGIVIVLVAGSAFLGGSAIARYVGADQAASDFTAEQIAPDQEEDRAEDLLADSSAITLATGLGFGGAVGFGLGSLYTALWAMRTGLLTRFWGTFGMAAGAAFLFLQFFFFMWVIYLGLLLAGWVPGGRPPAWAAGEAIPWPKPGEEPEGDAAPAAPPAAGETVEGSGRELSEPALPDEEGETQGQRRKKRKRRG